MIINDQKLGFGSKYDQLERGEDIKKSSELYPLSPFMEDGVIKMRSRLEKSDILPEQMKYPTILKSKSRLADLIIMDSHARQLHGGPEIVKRAIRNRFWITGGKRAITSVLNKCHHKQCVLRRVKPIIQASPPLPIERMGSDCYENISLDACGPFYIKLCGVCNFSATCKKCN